MAQINHQFCAGNGWELQRYQKLLLPARNWRYYCNVA